LLPGREYTYIREYAGVMRKTVGACLGLIGMGLLLGSCGGDGDDDLAPTARERLYRLAQAALLYTGDSDDIVMLPNEWMDGMEPYVTDSAIFRAPGVAEGEYGIALNTLVAGQSLTSLPTETTVMLFDSTVLTRNATAALDTLPNPGRYNGTNVMAMADGTVPGYEPGPDPRPDPIDVSVQRLKQLSVAAQIYSSDFDDHFPLADWMDGLDLYVGSGTNFYSPAFTFGGEQYGYALNSAMVGVSMTSLENPSTDVLLFDSVKTERNAVDTATAVPNPGRYGGENAVGFADGSVKKVRP